MKKRDELEVGFKAEMGELYMLNKAERVLVREILCRALGSNAGREFIAELFGREGIQLAKTLFEEMED